MMLPFRPIFRSSLARTSTKHWIRGYSHSQVLGTTARDFAAFADASDAVMRNGKVAVVCSQDSADTAAVALGKSFHVIKPLET